jgi:hypothetical protein
MIRARWDIEVDTPIERDLADDTARLVDSIDACNHRLRVAHLRHLARQVQHSPSPEPSC